jgi:hypothetical protein
MEQIVMRHGCSEGPRNPSLVDVEQALADIESGRDQRPEFSIEYVSNWKREIEEGREVARMLSEGRWLGVARFYPDDETAPGGWLVLFREDDDGYALAADKRTDAPFVEGSCCGGPLTVRANCIVPASMVIAAVGPYLSRRERCPSSTWLPESQIYQFG